MKNLTKKHEIVLSYLKSFFRENGAMPSIRELRDELRSSGYDMNSPRTVHKYLNDLKDAGVVRRNSHTKVLELLDQGKMLFVDIPVYGSANCGIASIVAEQYRQGTLKVSKSIVGQKNIKNLFAIQASGESMNNYKVRENNIEDGSFVLVDGGYKPSINDNNIPVLAVIDGLATIKLLRYVEQDRIGLFPCSTEEEFLPIYLTEEDDLIVNGKVIDVLKS
jgi:SOS-response transcriptional repressor LexA